MRPACHPTMRGALVDQDSHPGPMMAFRRPPGRIGSIHCRPENHADTDAPDRLAALSVGNRQPQARGGDAIASLIAWEDRP